jgi:uncharacterized protein YbjT (DUF2867 family)
MKKILIAGATGNLGPHLVKELTLQGHRVNALIRPETMKNDQKMCLLREAGVHIIEGDLNDPASLAKACEGQEVVISAVGAGQIMLQVELAKAAKTAGVKRFIPSEFGVDPFAASLDSCDLFNLKAAAQKQIRDIGIPLTPIYTNGFMEFWATGLGQLGPTSPPAKVQLFSDGTKDAYMVALPDIARYVNAIVEDPSTVNRDISICAVKTNQLDLINTWEQISGKKVVIQSVSSLELDQIIDNSQTSETVAQRIFTQLHRSVWIRGEGTSKREIVLEATRLYPEIKPQTLQDYFSHFN